MLKDCWQSDCTAYCSSGQSLLLLLSFSSPPPSVCKCIYSIRVNVNVFKGPCATRVVEIVLNLESEHCWPLYFWVLLPTSDYISALARNMPAPHLVPIKRVKAGTSHRTKGELSCPHPVVGSVWAFPDANSCSEIDLLTKHLWFSYLSWSKQQLVPTIGDNNSLQNTVCLQSNSIPNCFVPPPPPALTCFDNISERVLHTVLLRL